MDTKSLEAMARLVSDQPTSPDTSKIDMIEEKRRNAELVAWVKSCYAACKSDRNQTELQWSQNLFFMRGQHYSNIFQHSTGNRLVTPKAPPYRVRLAINRIRPMVRSEIARLTSQRPTASANPQSSEDEDQMAAYAAEQLWETIYRTHKVDEMFEEAVFWMVVCGTSYVKTFWNPTTIVEGEVMGDVEFGAVSPFHLYVPEMRTVDIQKQPYIINAYVKPLEWVKNFYGDKLDGVAADSVASQEIVSDTIMNITGGNQAEPDSVLCLEMWVKPGGHRLLPRGGLIHVINNKIIHLATDGIPYVHGEYPFAKLSHTPTGKFYGESVVTDLIQLNREYNRVRSQISESGNRMGNPQWVAAKGSIVPSRMTSEPGAIISYVPGLGAPPQQVPPMPIPNYVVEQLNRILMDMEDISAQHEVSRGSVPPGVEAATAIAFLQERDDSMLSTAYSSVERCYETMARQTMYLVKQYWDRARKVATTGTDSSFDVLMLDGNSISTAIYMEGGSALPTSKAAKQAFIMDLIRGQVIPPEDGLRMMDMGGTTKIYQKMKVDHSQAQRENVKMKLLNEDMIMNHINVFKQQQAAGDPKTVDPVSGQPLDTPCVIAPNTWDNHEVHVEVHNQFRKTQAFETLSDAVKAEFEKHVMMHDSAINDAMAQVQAYQMMQAMGASGGPPVPGQSPDMPPDMGMDPSLPPEAQAPAGDVPPNMGGM